ncbi:MAG: FAD-linked oxidase C-terminal domain-containing protein [Anaerolineae bacterium]
MDGEWNGPAGVRDYQAVTPAIAEELRQIVGEPHVLYSDPAAMQDYAHDEVAGEEHAHMPEAVVKPRSAEEISQILKLANRERVPVTPRGAGSGLSCGAVPVHGGIVLSVERMNRILEIDRENMVAVVEPGVVTNDVNDAIEEYGLFYAGYPMSVELCFVGGNVAENAGGGRAIKYGVTGRYVLGLEVVLPTGEIVELGGRRVKDVTGYDLIHLMVGSEGTLGVFTKITLRLLPRPTARAVLLVPFADTRTAIGAVPRVMTRGRIIPTSVEFMDRHSIEAAYDYTGERLPHPDVGAMLLIELDGTSEERVEDDMNSLIDLCMELGALDIFVGNTPRDERRMWRPRQEMAEALKAICPVQSLEDIVVPMAQIPALVSELDRLSRAYDVLIPCYGHAGDGNLHATVVKKPETPTDEWEEKLSAILEELYTAVAGLGGTISGEHGIGSKRARFLPLVMNDKLIELQRGVKRLFDPKNILNPGKIFPPARRGDGQDASDAARDGKTGA